MSIIKSTDETYKKILEDNKLVLIDFWAPWCAPCVQLSPILEQIDKELNGKLIIAKHENDSEPNFPTSNSVRGIPTMQIYKSGKLVDTLVGLTNKSDLLERIKPHID